MLQHGVHVPKKINARFSGRQNPDLPSIVTIADCFDMNTNLPKFHSLDIEYNDHGCFTAAAPETEFLSVDLYTSTEGFIYLGVKVCQDRAVRWQYWIKTIKPGDRLKFKYDGKNDDHGKSIDKIEELNRPDEIYTLPDGSLRLGLDVHFMKSDDRPETVRLSHPKDGGFTVMLANIPRDHARVWAIAGNETEVWSWQLEDLYPNDWIEFTVVETDWCDPFPNVRRLEQS